MKYLNTQHVLSLPLALSAWLGAAPASVQAAPDAAMLKRGAELIQYGGCADCHMPLKMGATGPEKDVTRGMSGHPDNVQISLPPKLDGKDWNWAGSATMTAFSGPWGISYASNLTPDRETGIGNWTARDFIAAMRSGKHLGAGRPIMPPMPWQSVGSLKDRDLRALYTYLMAQPAVKNRVVEYQPPVAVR